MGKPSVVVVADALTGPADAMLRLCGMPDYPYLVTPFPVGNLDRAEIDARADTMIDDVVRLLCERTAIRRTHPATRAARRATHLRRRGRGER